MKTIKLLFVSVFSIVMLQGCSVAFYGDNDIPPSLDQVLSSHDLWYIDYHRTVGNTDVPFVSKAFTMSFFNGVMYANNNIVDVGRTGNGLGIDVGVYNTFNGLLSVNHDLDGLYEFEVTLLSPNQIELHNYRLNVSYFLIGYSVNTFNYDALFYDNIEYFLQEYVGWEKVDALGGTPNPFDAENYLAFTPENITTFYSSKDDFGIDVDLVNWDYVGSYEVFDVVGYQDLKVLELYYDGGVVEEFELTVTNDRSIRLYHINSGTTYDFAGRGFIQFLKSDKVKIKDGAVRNSDRKRTKVIRRSKSKNI
ncbi:MAG: hypothetical protein CMB99_08995 [Flavobacteriaceae bacterium]|nr:hypothetical protein [Flavobacteriaceae bacterium]|tara:strand:+ start:538077 stop:538997 length:921 start_codon:yes stop_codon:yes gene_type:complete